MQALAFRLECCIIKYMSHLKTTTVSTSNKSSKDILARAMAQEDIYVEHSASAETAAFDVKNRRLILPMWKDMDDALYDMLVGHEVSHALNTPADGWQEFVGNGPKASMRHMFVNVVEDARIERMIKAKFPGLRRDFAAAYASLHERDLFQIAEKDLTELPLIDRLNLHFKIGLFGLETITFSPDEQQYVTRMAETKTFEEVMVLSEELFNLWNDEQEEPEQDNGEDQEPGEGEGEGDGPSGEQEQEQDEDQPKGNGSSGGDTGEGDTEGESGESGESGDGDDSGESMEDDTDDGESAESESGDGGESAGENPTESGEATETGTEQYDNYQSGVNQPGATQAAMEQGVNDLRDEYARDMSYHDLPTPNLENIVVTPKRIAEEFVSFHESGAWKSQTEARAKVDAELKTYRNSIKGTVAQMVQTFQMKQAADASKRTEVAKTGVLDPVSMINYRWSEDIFRKNETHAEGKNHGMIIYLDWSGSMMDIMQDTMDQLLVLVEFCRKVNIPFEVYAFSSVEPSSFSGVERQDYEGHATWNKENPSWNGDGMNTRSFCLLNLLSSKMNKRQFEFALTNLWYLRSYNSSGRYSDECVYCPSNLGLGATPLNEAVLCAMTQVPEFQNANGVQIVSTVFLTDGEGSSILPYGYGRTTVLRDPKTRKTVEIDRGVKETDALVGMLRENTGANAVGIRLHNAKNVTQIARWQEGINEDIMREMNTAYKKNNFCSWPNSSYNESFVIKGNTEVTTDAMESLSDDASMTKIRNAFIKGGTKKKSSRVIANRMVEIFSVAS